MGKTNEPQSAYGLYKLGEHPPLILPWHANLRWMLKWGIEGYLAYLPPLAAQLRKRGWVDMFLGMRRWDDR